MCPARAALSCRSHQPQRTRLGMRHADRWAGPGFAGWIVHSGAPGRAQRMESRPVWLDQKQARNPLSTELGKKFQLCPEGNREPCSILEQE